MLPQSYISVTGKAAEQMYKLMEALEDNDDVQKVYTNADIAEDAVDLKAIL
jgi:transcriptional/translational regulatory protein YebC/TACO1